VDLTIPYSIFFDILGVSESFGYVCETLIADIIMLQLFELREIQICFQCIYKVQMLCISKLKLII